MGIASSQEEIDMKDTQVSPNSLLKHKFNGFRLVKPQHLKAKLLESVTSPELVDIHDTVRILILHVMSCILFVMSNEVASVSMFRICDNLKDLCNYNWGNDVLSLML